MVYAVNYGGIVRAISELSIPFLQLFCKKLFQNANVGLKKIYKNKDLKLNVIKIFFKTLYHIYSKKQVFSYTSIPLSHLGNLIFIQ